MRSLVVGFSTPKKFKLASFFIRLFERSEYSHVFIKMNPSSSSSLDFSKVFQASHGDVNAISYDVFKEQNKIFNEYEIKLTDQKYFEIAHWLWHQLGKPYGFLQLIAIAFGFNISKNKDSAFICSELAAMVLRDHLNYDINKNLDYIGLNDIKKIMEKGI